MAFPLGLVVFRLAQVSYVSVVFFFPCSGTGWRCRIDCALAVTTSCWASSVRRVVLIGEDGSRGWRAVISPSPHSLFSSSSLSESGSDLAWWTACHYHHSDTQKGKAKSWKVLGGWRGGGDWEEEDRVLSSYSPSGRATGLDVSPLLCVWSCLPLTHLHSHIPESRGVDADTHAYNKIRAWARGVSKAMSVFS